jgi:ribosome assembly protein YihI (activator of Der GTPase)
VSLEALPLSLDAQVRHPGPVWLDTLDAMRLTAKGFGAAVGAALERRHHVLRELGIAADDPERGAKIADLKRVAVGREIARQSGQ